MATNTAVARNPAAKGKGKGKRKTEKMYSFTWEGVDRRGRRIKGEVNMQNAALVKADLRRQGINPLKVRQKSTLLSFAKKKVRPRDVAIFSRQLATMLSAGVPLVQAMDIIAQGHDNPAVRDLVNTERMDLAGGSALSVALYKHPAHFDELYVNLVGSGEQAGVLDQVLHKIATYKERTESLKSKVKKAMFYPVAVIAVAIIVTSIIMIFVIPQFKQLFEGYGSDLPVFTTVVIHISEWMQRFWWLLLLIVIAGVVMFMNALKRSRKFHHAVDRMTLKIPVLGPILHKSAVARFARTLSTMFGAGVPLVESLESVAGATGNIVYADGLLRIRDEVSTGQSLELALRQSKMFPSMVVQMVAIGEESGSLDTMLAKVADFYEEEVENAIDALMSLIEPLLMVVLGVVIGGLVIAMYLPIFQLGQAVLGK